MEISVTFRHVEPNEPLREYAEEKISRIKKYLDRRVSASIVLAAEKRRYIAEVKVTGDGFALNSKESSTENLFVAIDLVLDKIMNQASRYKTKQQKRKGPSELTIRHNIIALEGVSDKKEPRIIETENYFVKPMTVEEAFMQLNLIKNEFLVFTNAESNRVNVLYQRRDGNYGLIDSVGFGE